MSDFAHGGRRAAILGAGPMGLTAAYELLKRGWHVDLCERDDRIGGMTASTELDGLKLLERAIKHQVAFVPGRDFFPTDGGSNYLRLNFSNSAPERIREGVSRLGALCREG